MDSRLVAKPKALPKSLLLKDYLLDDMSSCSSNGFKSFPRRQQCCTTVRFLIEIDLIRNKEQLKKQKMPSSNSSRHKFDKNLTPSLLKTPKSTTGVTLLRRVINAVKRLPFASTNTTQQEEKKKMRRKAVNIIPRNLSMKIIKRSTSGSFWKIKKGGGKEKIERWTSFNQWLKDSAESLDCSNDYTSSSSTDGGKSKSWSTEFTEFSSSGKFSSEVNLKLPDDRAAANDVVEEVKEVVSSKDAVGVTNGDVSTDSTPPPTSSGSSSASTVTSMKASTEEKEQSSPVSVLDCPFDDEDDEVSSSSSPFQHRLASMEGTKKKLMQKIQRLECLAQLEPVNLAKRFAPDIDSESIGSPLPRSSSSIDEKFISDIEDDNEQGEEDENEIQAEQKPLELLHQLEDTLPSYGLRLKAEKLLLDFFREKIVAQNARGRYSFEEEILEEAENWINEKKTRELFLEWAVPRNRPIYMKDMEKGGEWKSTDQERKEVALELESEVFAALLNELLADISPEETV